MFLIYRPVKTSICILTWKEIMSRNSDEHHLWIFSGTLLILCIVWLIQFRCCNPFAQGTDYSCKHLDLVHLCKFCIFSSFLSRVTSFPSLSTLEVSLNFTFHIISTVLSHLNPSVLFSSWHYLALSEVLAHSRSFCFIGILKGEK